MSERIRYWEVARQVLGIIAEARVLSVLLIAPGLALALVSIARRPR